MNFGLGAALEKQISWRVKGTLSRLRWSGGVLPGRSHVPGTAGNPARLLPGRPPGSAVSEPSRTVADARKLGVPPAPIRGTLTLKIHLPTLALHPPSAVRWHLGQLEACTAEADRPAPRGVWESGIQSAAEGFKPIKLPQSSLLVSFCRQYLLPFFARSYTAHLQSHTVVPRVSWGLTGLMKGAARVLGPWALEHSWQHAKGPGVAIVPKCVSIPRTSWKS